MKKMTHEEFIQRTNEVAKANRIFGNLTDNNISLSFQMYQEILAEEKMEVFISTSMGGNRRPTPMDAYERPKCPECHLDMRLRIDALDVEGTGGRLRGYESSAWRSFIPLRQ
jgi:hypothetical protein